MDNNNGDDVIDENFDNHFDDVIDENFDDNHGESDIDEDGEIYKNVVNGIIFDFELM